MGDQRSPLYKTIISMDDQKKPVYDHDIILRFKMNDSTEQLV